MFTGFARCSDNTVHELGSLGDLAASVAARDGVVWADLEAPGDDELRALGEAIGADEAALADCLPGDQRPRIDEYEAHVLLVLYGAIGAEPDPLFEPKKLAIFCAKQYLVTVHPEPLRTITTLRDRCTRHAAKTMANGLDTLLHQIIDMMVDNFVDMADRYEIRLEELEERSLSPDVDESILEDILTLRRDILELRRVAASQRELVAPLAEGEFDYVSEDLAQRFRHVRDHLIKVVEIIDAQRERLTSARDNYHTALASRTNDAMRALTVFAAVLLPVTVVASIYGMNLPVWPSPEHPESFWIVLAVMVGIAGSFLFYFKRRGWI